MTETKNLGDRTLRRVRLGPASEDAVDKIAKLVPLPANSVIVLAVMLMGAQFAPYLATRGLSLDLLEAEFQELFAEARRLPKTLPAPARKGK